ncbi:MAG: DMT family transporter [Salaquimonas sp.]
MSSTSSKSNIAPKLPKPTLEPATHAENIRGSSFMVLSMAGFAINDTIVKSVGESLNLGQTLFIRGCFACIAIFIMAHFFGHLRPIREMLSKPILVRAAGEMLATFAFVTALFHIPIANVAAIFQALPLALTLYAALFLREQVGWRRLAAICVGFIGILIIIRPGTDGFNIYSLLVLIAVAGSVLRDVTTRKLPKTTPSLMVTLITAIGVTLMGGVTALIEPWNPVSPANFGLLAATSIFLSIGYFGVINAMREGDIGFVSPFRYSVLLFSIIGGIVVFGDYPDQWTLLGSLIVVASGIYTLYRERIVHSQKITPPPSR